MGNNNKIHIFKCLHCGEDFMIQKSDFNCKILRHAVYKNSMHPINPHTPKEECDRLVAEGLVYGCAKPLRISKEKNKEGNYEVEICDYI